MKNQERKVESELSQTFEPLRTVFALLALFLGLIASVRL